LVAVAITRFAGPADAATIILACVHAVFGLTIVILPIVTAGDALAARDYFIETLRRRAQEVSLLQIPLDIKIEYSRLGNKVGAIGAAAFTIQEFFK